MWTYDADGKIFVVVVVARTASVMALDGHKR